MKKYFGVATVILMLALAPTAKADSMTSIGNTASGFANGTTQTTVAVQTAESGQAAPFSAICGSDIGTGNSCSTNWTFSNAAIGSGQTVTGATLTLGIWDIDSKATGNQVANFAITGGESLTSSLNIAAEALNINVGSLNSEFDIFTLTLSAASFNQLALGNTNVVLALQGPGLGVIGTTPSNGAGLIFSSLNIQTTAVVSAVPEPSTLELLVIGIGSLTFLKQWRKAGRPKPNA